jgi:hypothetical protein
MNLKKLAVSNANEGAELELRDLAGNPTGIFINLVSADSGGYQEFIRKFQNRRLQHRRGGMPSIEEIDAMNLQALCKAAMKGWRTGEKPTIEYGDEVLEFTPENAMRIFGDQELRDLREQCQEFIDNRSNFLAKPVKG